MTSLCRLSLILLIHCVAHSVTAQTSNPAIRLRFLDSATGRALRPDYVETQSRGPSAGLRRWTRGELPRSGQARLALEQGRHQITAYSSDHFPMSGELVVSGTPTGPINFLLDPLEPPEELRPDVIASLLQDHAMLLQGFVTDTESGEPLTGVRVASSPSGAEASTDDRGFFRFYVPAAESTEVTSAATTLVFEKPGYGTHERLCLELWPRGDWTYRISLEPNGPGQVVDERTSRRRAPTSPVPVFSPALPTLSTETATALAVPETDAGAPPLNSTAPSNATVRIPRNIRVLRSDNVTIDYVSLAYYARCVLPSEWIPSWANYTGGSNSLNAGAVAARCYAIAKINNASATSTYDICATTSCQVYNPANINSLTDRAVAHTADWVVINSSGAIPSTEYSAENNSLAYSCGDGFTQPSTGCLYDPACSGETRYGHGRGMCQWGTARWATGRRMASRSSSDGTSNGYARRDWQWIVRHYYPTYTLVKAAQLVVGDDIRALKSLDVRACAGGVITNGTGCALVSTKASGSTGVILGGPIAVTNDGKGFTWYQVRWSDNAVGWSVENYLERVYSTPTTPTGLVATSGGTNEINLTWTDTTAVETGFEIDRAASASGPWTQRAVVGANVAAYTDRNLFPGNAWHYRVRAYNAGGDSPNSATANATTANLPPAFPAIPGKSVVELSPLTFTVPASAPDFTQLLTDFENFPSETANGLVLFREPYYSPSTATHLDIEPNIAAVTDAFPTTGHATGAVLRVQCEFTNTSNPWLRLTTSGTANWPNPVIPFAKKLRFDLYADKAVKVALGCRESTVTSGTPVGSNGGTTGAIEWVGVTNIAGSAPMPTRMVNAGAWTTLIFNLPNEPVRSFSGGNGVLSTASGLGVLEHLALVPAGGTGIYNLYLDNFVILSPRTVTYSLANGAPTNASIHPTSGTFAWTPTEAQGPATNSIAVIVKDNNTSSMSATQTFAVVVGETNTAPVLAGVPDRTIHASTWLTFTNAASDSDLPSNILTFAFDAAAPSAATLNPESGIFSWPTSDADAGTTNRIRLRVTDNGQPMFSAAQEFSVTILPKPQLTVILPVAGGAAFSWSSIPGVTYRVQFKQELDDSAWTDLRPDIVATGPTTAFTNTPATERRFYRITWLNP